jgi:hypothetical protein
VRRPADEADHQPPPVPLGPGALPGHGAGSDQGGGPGLLAAVDETLAAAGIPERPTTVLADSGYWSIANLTTIPEASELLIWPAKAGRTGKPRMRGQRPQPQVQASRFREPAWVGRCCFGVRQSLSR